MIFEITTDENKEYACADSILQVLQGIADNWAKELFGR